MNDRNRFVEKNTMLVREFDRYVLEYPEFTEKIPDNALVVMQIVGDDEFNEWARRTAQGMAEKDTPIVYCMLCNREGGAIGRACGRRRSAYAADNY